MLSPEHTRRVELCICIIFVLSFACFALLLVRLLPESLSLVAKPPLCCATKRGEPLSRFPSEQTLKARERLLSSLLRVLPLRRLDRLQFALACRARLVR